MLCKVTYHMPMKVFRPWLVKSSVRSEAINLSFAGNHWVSKAPIHKIRLRFIWSFNSLKCHLFMVPYLKNIFAKCRFQSLLIWSKYQYFRSWYLQWTQTVAFYLLTLLSFNCYDLPLCSLPDVQSLYLRYILGSTVSRSFRVILSSEGIKEPLSEEAYRH